MREIATLGMLYAQRAQLFAYFLNKCFIPVRALAQEPQTWTLRPSVLPRQVAIVGQLFRTMEFIEHALFTGIETCGFVMLSANTQALSLHILRS